MMFARLLPWLPFTLLTSLAAPVMPQKVDQDALILLTACSNAVKNYTAVHFSNPKINTCQDQKLDIRENGGIDNQNETVLDSKLVTEVEFLEGLGPSKISVRSASGEWLTRIYRDAIPGYGVSYIVRGKGDNIGRSPDDAEAVDLLLSCEIALLRSIAVNFSTEHFPGVKTCNDSRLVLKNASGYGPKIISPTKLITEVQANENSWVINVQSGSGRWFSLSQIQGNVFINQPSILLEGKAKL